MFNTCSESWTEARSSALTDLAYPQDQRIHMWGARERVDVLRRLLRMGYEDPILISQDSIQAANFSPSQAAVQHANPDWRITYFIDQVRPQLLENDIDESVIDRILTDNVRRLFSEDRPY